MNEWRFFCANGGNQSRQVWVVWEEKLRWLHPRWWNSRWLPSSSWVRINEFESDWISLSQSFVQNGWIQDAEIQRWWNWRWLHHQVEWEWMSLSQIELVWVRVRVSESLFEWIWEKKTRCLNETWQNSRWLPSSSWVRMTWWSFLNPPFRIQDGCHHQVESEWMSEGFYFVQMVGTNLAKCEWVWEEKLRWLNPT